MYNHNEYIEKNKQIVPKGKWRLPTIAELFNTFDREKGTLKVDRFAPYCYWSSTTCADRIGSAWYVNFQDGGHANGSTKGNGYYVICVRTTAHNELEWGMPSETQLSWHEAIQYAKDLQ